jgi:hypothetical protein
MSDVLYPVSLMQNMSVKRLARVLADDFEDGGSSTRKLWPDKYFKRRFEFIHSPLTLQEMEYLRSFYVARNGRYDSFWFRDNINRGGNAKVRFAMDLDEVRSSGVYPVQVALEEVQPIRAMPDIFEVATAAGTAPKAWYDANRERYFAHAGTNYDDHVALYDAAGNRWPLLFQNYPQPNYELLENILGQHQNFLIEGTEFETASNFTDVATGQPAFTIFGFFKNPANTNNALLFAIGNRGTAQQALGLRLHADVYKPYVGSLSETWATAVYTNSPLHTWRSIALVWAASSNSVSLYVNGTLIGSESNTRSHVQGPLWMRDETSTFTRAAHPMVFGAALTLAQVKALHNLFAYQYGLATV